MGRCETMSWKCSIDKASLTLRFTEGISTSKLEQGFFVIRESLIPKSEQVIMRWIVRIFDSITFPPFSVMSVLFLLDLTCVFPPSIIQLTSDIKHNTPKFFVIKKVIHFASVTINCNNWLISICEIKRENVDIGNAPTCRYFNILAVRYFAFFLLPPQ